MKEAILFIKLDEEGYIYGQELVDCSELSCLFFGSILSLPNSIFDPIILTHEQYDLITFKKTELELPVKVVQKVFITEEN